MLAKPLVSKRSEDLTVYLAKMAATHVRCFSPGAILATEAMRFLNIREREKQRGLHGSLWVNKWGAAWLRNASLSTTLFITRGHL